MDANENHSHFGDKRLTAPRRAIAAAVDGFDRAFTVDDLVVAVSAVSPGTGTATVYRAVGAMEAAGSIERIGSRDESALYVRCCIEGHHHHLVCTGCWKVSHTACPLDEETPRQATADGFVVTDHEITLYGLCTECCAEQPSANGRPRED